MKGTCALLASVMAASTLALSSSFSPQHQFNCISTATNTIPSSSLHQRAALSAVKDRLKIWPAQHASGEDKFAPKFDGLRFIETLVTAHSMAKQVQLQAAGEIPRGLNCVLLMNDCKCL